MDADLEKFKAVMSLLSTGGTSAMVITFLYVVWTAYQKSNADHIDDLRKNQRPTEDEE